MASSEELRINKNQHKTKQKQIDKNEINKLKSKMIEIRSFLEEKFNKILNNKKYEIKYGSSITFEQIHKNIIKQKTRTEFDYFLKDRQIKPNGGYLYLEDKSDENVKFILLIAEMKRQGTNDQRKKEGKKEQSSGNAIERLGKDLTGIRAMFNHDRITPFVCFGYGCDFEVNKTVKSKLSTLNEFYPINKIYVWKRDGTTDYNDFAPVTMYFRKKPWDEKEIIEILKEIVETTLRYYIY